MYGGGTEIHFGDKPAKSVSSSTVEAMEKKGLIKCITPPGFGVTSWEYELTELGREMVSQHN